MAIADTNPRDWTLQTFQRAEKLEAVCRFLSGDDNDRQVHTCRLSWDLCYNELS